MRRLLALAVAAILGLSACGSSGGEPEPSAETGAEEAPAAVADVARVVCEPAVTRLETPTVKPQSDGIHFEIVNEAGAERSFSVQTAASGMGQGAPVGTSTLVGDLPPGSMQVACNDPASTVQQTETLEVVDEDGVYVDAMLACTEVSSATVDYAQAPTGVATPEAAARLHAGASIRPDDTLAPAGYPEAAAPSVGVTRSGELIAVIGTVDDGQGGWYVVNVSSCPAYED